MLFRWTFKLFHCAIVIFRKWLALICCLSLFFPVVAFSETLTVDTPNVSFSVNVISIAEAKFLTTVKQEHDFSCGSAAVATLLTHHYKHPVSEADAFWKMYEDGDKELVRKAGFSLLDIKNFLQSKGYQSDGFRFPLATVKKLGLPAIVLLDDDGYKHFVVVKGLDDTHVLLGDPAKGTRYMTRLEFEEAWNGIVFMIRSKKIDDEMFFNINDPSGIIARAPLDTVLSRNGLAGSIIPLSTYLEF